MGSRQRGTGRIAWFVTKRIPVCHATRRPARGHIEEGGAKIIVMAAIPMPRPVKAAWSVMKKGIMFRFTRNIGHRVMTGWQTNSTVIPATIPG
jgi:hypothetical protein